MPPSSTTLSHDTALQSLLGEFEQHIARGQILLSRLTELAPQKLASREWAHLQIPHKLIDVQTQLEYAIWHERTNHEHLIAHPEDFHQLRARYEEDKKNSQLSNSQLQTPEADPEVSDIQFEESQRMSLEPAESQLQERQSVQLPVSTTQLVCNRPVITQFTTPQKQAAGHIIRSDIPAIPRSGSIIPNRPQAATLATTSNVQATTTTKTPTSYPPPPRVATEPIVKPVVPSSRALPKATNTKATAGTKRRRRGSSEESENSDYSPPSSEQSSVSVSLSPSASPALTPTPSKRSAPPAKRQALGITPTRRPPSATPRPASAFKWRTPHTPSMGTAKTNQQLLASFVTMDIGQVNTLSVADLQTKFAEIKALQAYAKSGSKPELIGRFMEWQNTMLELERGEGEAEEQAMTPSQPVTPRIKIKGKSDEELLEGFVFKNAQQLNSMKAKELEIMIRGVEALRRYFDSVTKKSMIDVYMKWQRDMVVMQREREEEEEEESGAREGRDEEMPTEGVAPSTTPEVIDLTSDGED